MRLLEQSPGMRMAAAEPYPSPPWPGVPRQLFQLAGALRVHSISLAATVAAASTATAAATLAGGQAAASTMGRQAPARGRKQRRRVHSIFWSATVTAAATATATAAIAVLTAATATTAVASTATAAVASSRATWSGSLGSPPGMMRLQGLTGCACHAPERLGASRLGASPPSPRVEARALRCCPR